MPDKYDVGICKPPKSNQWKKGQSSNPKGRPKPRSDFVQDAAAILSEPVCARTTAGRVVSLNGYEAAYLTLCKKGLKGHGPSLIKVIQIMLEVQRAIDDREAKNGQVYERVLAILDRGGVKGGGKKKRNRHMISCSKYRNWASCRHV
jgi:hypothetical protein